MEVVETVYSKRHGSPFDRGSADAYYGRPYLPHYFVGATYFSDKVTVDNMTQEEIEAYTVGYESQTERKSWKD